MLTPGGISPAHDKNKPGTHRGLRVLLARDDRQKLVPLRVYHKLVHALAETSRHARRNSNFAADL